MKAEEQSTTQKLPNVSESLLLRAGRPPRDLRNKFNLRHISVYFLHQPHNNSNNNVQTQQPLPERPFKSRFLLLGAALLRFMRINLKIFRFTFFIQRIVACVCSCLQSLKLRSSFPTHHMKFKQQLLQLPYCYC